MNKVTTINLNGRAYQLEERGFEVLRKYLDTAAAKLHGNPDKDEIMADFEQAIADKFDQKLNGHKDVISERETEDIIAGMGPVDAEGSASAENSTHAGSAADNGSAGASGSATSGSTGAPKHLFRIPLGEWIAGVCNGLAAYFNIDVTLMRIIFIILTLITHGFMILAYIVLWVVMPVAHNEEERAQAHGWTARPPFNAHDFIEQAKARYADLQKMHDEHKAKMAAGQGSAAEVKEDSHKWKRDFKKEMRQKKQQMKQEWRAQQYEWRQSRRDWHDSYYDDRDRRYGAGYGISRAIFGFFAVIVSIVLLAVGFAWALSLYTLIKYGTVFGYVVGAGHPLWLSIVFLCAAFYIIASPFRLLLQHAWGNARYQSGWNEFARAVVFFAVLAVLIYTARELFPQANAWWETGAAWLKAKI